MMTSKNGHLHMSLTKPPYKTPCVRNGNTESAQRAIFWGALKIWMQCKVAKPPLGHRDQAHPHKHDGNETISGKQKHLTTTVPENPKKLAQRAETNQVYNVLTIETF